MMNKRGSHVLRDVVFMMMIISSIFVFAGLFVSEISSNYGNTNMTSEWDVTQTNTLGDSLFNDSTSDMEGIGETLEGGTYDLIIGGLKSIGNVIVMIIAAPNTIGALFYGLLIDIGVGTGVATTVYILISGLLWVVVAFTIYSAFLQGGKL